MPLPGNPRYPGVDKITKQPGGLVCLYGSVRVRVRFRDRVRFGDRVKVRVTVGGRVRVQVRVRVRVRVDVLMTTSVEPTHGCEHQHVSGYLCVPLFMYVFLYVCGVRVYIYLFI